MKMTQDGFQLDREDDAFPCPECGGFSERVQCTPEELAQHNCGKSWECCARAFTCVGCGYHFAMRAPAPDMDF